MISVVFTHRRTVTVLTQIFAAKWQSCRLSSPNVIFASLVLPYRFYDQIFLFRHQVQALCCLRPKHASGVTSAVRDMSQTRRVMRHAPIWSLWQNTLMVTTNVYGSPCQTHQPYIYEQVLGREPRPSGLLRRRFRTTYGVPSSVWILESFWIPKPRGWDRQVVPKRR